MRIGAYERLLEAKAQFRMYGLVMIVLGLGLNALQLWVPGGRYPGFMLFVMGLYSTSLADFQARLIAMQSRLDMLRVAKGQEPE